MTRNTILTTALLAAFGLVGHAACDANPDPSSQTNNVDERTEDVCKPPRILFVVDASSSMKETIEDDGPTKWEALQGAVEAITTTHEGTGLFGLMTFPGAAGGCAPGDVQVEPAPYNEGLINESIATLIIPDDAATPAGQTLMRAASLLDDSYENHVVFISDGWQYCSVANEAGAPTCALPTDCETMGLDACASCNSCQVNSTTPSCQGQNADGCHCVRNWPVLGVQALKDAGANTYVVGFGNNVDTQTLNQAAVIGGDPLPDCDPDSTEPSCFLKATSSGELTDALDAVMLRLTRAPCQGACGIRGKKKCTLDGWSECQAPQTITCRTECRTEGTQQCVEGELSPCSATCDEPSDTTSSGSGGAGGSGGDGGESTTSGTGGAGGEGTTGSTGGAGGGSSGVGGWPDSDDPWTPPDEDWDSEGGGELPTGIPESTEPSPEAEGGCTVSPSNEGAPKSAWSLLALAALAMLRRRRDS